MRRLSSRRQRREWTWWAHTGVETPLCLNSPHGHMILGVDLVDGGWKRPCLQFEVESTFSPFASPGLTRSPHSMLEHVDGRTLLRERLRVTDEAVARCWELPPSTFGGAYAAFMGARGFKADHRPPVRYVDDAQLAYVATRAREVRRSVPPHGTPQKRAEGFDLVRAHRFVHYLRLTMHHAVSDTNSYQ